MRDLPVSGTKRQHGLVLVQFQGSQVRHDDQNTVIDVVRALQLVSFAIG